MDFTLLSLLIDEFYILIQSINQQYINDLNWIEFKDYPILYYYISNLKLNTNHFLVKQVQLAKELKNKKKSKFIKIKYLNKGNKSRIKTRMIYTYQLEINNHCIFISSLNTFDITNITDITDIQYDYIEYLFFDFFQHSDFFFKWRKYGYISILNYINTKNLSILLCCRLIYETVYFYCLNNISNSNRDYYINRLNLMVCSINKLEKYNISYKESKNRWKEHNNQNKKNKKKKYSIYTIDQLFEQKGYSNNSNIPKIVF